MAYRMKGYNLGALMFVKLQCFWQFSKVRVLVILFHNPVLTTETKACEKAPVSIQPDIPCTHPPGAELQKGSTSRAPAHAEQERLYRSVGSPTPVGLFSSRFIILKSGCGRQLAQIPHPPTTVAFCCLSVNG